MLIDREKLGNLLEVSLYEEIDRLASASSLCQYGPVLVMEHVLVSMSHQVI